jgi:hypothetical protein
MIVFQFFHLFNKKQERATKKYEKTNKSRNSIHILLDPQKEREREKNKAKRKKKLFLLI